MNYEYRVIPAPKRLKKIKGVSSTAELFAATLTDAINAEARDGWEYVRSEALAAEGPRGFLRRGAMVEETVMIFRRPRRGEAAREPALRDLPSREARQGEPAIEARGPAALRTPAAGPGRSRPLASLFARGESPSAEPHEAKPHSEPHEAKPHSGTGPSTPPLLRPVPRHKPGDKS